MRNITDTADAATGESDFLFSGEENADDSPQEDLVDEEVDLDAEDWFGSIEVDENAAFAIDGTSSPA
jgi:hypothetical protein